MARSFNLTVTEFNRNRLLCYLTGFKASALPKAKLKALQAMNVSDASPEQLQVIFNQLPDDIRRQAYMALKKQETRKSSKTGGKKLFSFEISADSKSKLDYIALRYLQQSSAEGYDREKTVRIIEKLIDGEYQRLKNKRGD